MSAIEVDGVRVTIREEPKKTPHPAHELRVGGRLAGLILPDYNAKRRFTGKWLFVTVGGVFPHHNTIRSPKPFDDAEEEAFQYARECIEDGAVHTKERKLRG